ncbi:serine/threonine-protein phosphatase 7 long form-like protein [Senna tora]|uniref:Serine/threonine-protein phosphatase 7 long form-like protein n=1 Tax=Senna tora TaxID=362788 RepID=A0A834TEC6_9FABA|nr:serine/threonine-protein phosphatase 7 long form-like protein [Senna tora]
MAARRQHINPGPENMSLLTQQQNHISEQIWNGDDSRELRSHRSCAVDDGLLPPCIVPYLIQAGFYGVSRVGHFEYVRPLIRALVERRRPETHTFHFPQGECTITLQDVALQLAVLGTLYRELCKAANPETEEIAGCLSLLHVWAWDRFPKLAPPRPPPRDPLAHIYQPLPPLAASSILQIDWTPYSSMFERGQIPNEYLQHPDIWRASVPLLNFATVEWHHSVLRQFGMTQPIPGPPRDLSDMHGLSLRNKSDQT